MATWFLRRLNNHGVMQKLSMAFSGKSTTAIGRRYFVSMEVGQKLDPYSCDDDYRENIDHQNQACLNSLFSFFVQS